MLFAFVTDQVSGGSRISQRGRLPLRGTVTYYLTNYSQKLHENEEILA